MNQTRSKTTVSIGIGRTLAMAATFLTLGLTSDIRAAIVTKLPDLGAYWQPLRPAGGTYVYANSFVAPISGQVTALGTWLNTLTFDASTEVSLEVWDSIGGVAANGPAWNQVLASTVNPLTGISGGLTYYTGGPVSSLSLVGGQTYWFAATVVGSPGFGAYQVGGHTQNTGSILDNGTFWYSNDLLGHAFDGQRLTPEMAFTVEMSPSAHVPDGGLTVALLGSALIGFAGVRRRFAV